MQRLRMLIQRPFCDSRERWGGCQGPGRLYKRWEVRHLLMYGWSPTWLTRTPARCQIAALKATFPGATPASWGWRLPSRLRDGMFRQDWHTLMPISILVTLRNA